MPEPKVVNGTPQTPIEGTSLAYTFDDGDAAERHTIQYFEMFGNRAIYNNGWFARTIHRAPWQTGKQKPLESDVWELYYVPRDFSLADDLSAQYPEKLKEMQDLFMWQAEIYHVLPIDDRKRVSACRSRNSPTPCSSSEACRPSTSMAGDRPPWSSRDGR